MFYCLFVLPFQTTGRVLPPPIILYEKEQVRINPNQTGSWRADRARFSNPATIEDIYVANFSRNDAGRAISMLLQTGRGIGEYNFKERFSLYMGPLL